MKNANNTIWFDTSGGSVSEKWTFKGGISAEKTRFDKGNKKAFEFILKLEKCTPDKLGLIYNSEIDNYEHS